MPLQATSGAASYDGFGGGVPFVPTYIEEVFSTYLYTGNSSTQTITNGIDLAGKGGLVWAKDRTFANSHQLYDTARGVQKRLMTDQTAAQGTETTGITAFNSNGWTMGAQYEINDSASRYASWTFRKQPKFFDVVTYTGDGVAGRTVSHNLGSTPGCIIVKKTSGADPWAVYHRSAAKSGYTAQESYLILSSTQQVEGPYSGYWNNTAPTSTVFTLGNDGWVNGNGATYVAYLFAHNAGGFGLTGSDNVISCGSYTGNGSATGPVINLGYEPQWLLVKNASFGTANWLVYDNMRGLPVGSNPSWLYPNTSAAEVTDSWGRISPTATGFQVATADAWLNQSGDTMIYIAIRRGPMKTPTSGTSVLGLNARTGTDANATVTGSAGVTDLAIIKRYSAAANWVWTPRLTNTGYLSSNSTAVETAAGTTVLQANPWDVMDGVKVGTTSTLTNNAGESYINYLFRRAPGFFDVVTYTGTGSARTVSHNLGVIPELMIVKCRSNATDWDVYHKDLGATKYLLLNLTNAVATDGGEWNNTTPTASVFTVGNAGNTNFNTRTYVAYLFATVAGVSKVGSYTGNGSSQTINCGFTSGARFVMIKRTDDTSDWFVFDSARGIVASNDPFLVFNTTADQIATSDGVDADNSGFIVNQNATSPVNVNAATYIFLAIA